ncbi:MAG: deoxyribose-phosphate aldolase [Thermotogaceae bacterium]|nr:deoxyribose-phosphate aldolase [Thermotogaceae bacterium]
MEIKNMVDEWIEKYHRKYQFELDEGRMVSKNDVRSAIEHTNLKPTATPENIRKLCEEAKEHNFYGVCVNPVYVKLAKDELKGSNQKVVTVCGFPLGATPSQVKACEARRAVQDGADEVDMVINIGLLKAREYEKVYEDIKSVVEAAGVPVKVIIEACYLTDEEKVAACVISKLAGAAYVKTSTGFGSGGATVEDVHLMRWVIGRRMGVKAAGGIRDFETAALMIRAGANKIGTSSGVKIMESAK